jgi:hypothetical protein
MFGDVAKCPKGTLHGPQTRVVAKAGIAVSVTPHLAKGLKPTASEADVVPSQPTSHRSHCFHGPNPTTRGGNRTADPRLLLDRHQQ